MTDNANHRLVGIRPLAWGVIVFMAALLGGCASEVRPEAFWNASASEAISIDGKLKVRIKAILGDSSCSVDRVATEVQGTVMLVRVTELPVVLVAKEHIKGDIDLEVEVPKEVTEIKFVGASKPVWVHGATVTHNGNDKRLNWKEFMLEGGYGLTECMCTACIEGYCVQYQYKDPYPAHHVMAELTKKVEAQGFRKVSETEWGGLKGDPETRMELGWSKPDGKVEAVITYDKAVTQGDQGAARIRVSRYRAFN